MFRTNSKTAKCFLSKKRFMILSANAQTPQPKKQALDSYTTTLMFRDNSKPTKKLTRQKLFFQWTKLQNVRNNKTQSLCETPSPLLLSSYICSHGHNLSSRQSVETHRETDNENLSATVQKQLTKHPHASEKPQAIKTALCICLDGNCCRTDKWTSLRTNMY